MENRSIDRVFRVSSSFGLGFCLSSNDSQKMMNARRITDNLYLVNDILEGILSRLPFKTLMRLKRLCTLITTSWFISLHLKTFNSEPDNHCILVQTGQKNCLIRIRNPGYLIKLNEPCMSNYTVVHRFNQFTTTSSRKLIFPFHKSIQDVPSYAQYEPSNDTLH
ncbi:hypothetical protein H5410_006679 [Solanum commersonii]|uniref:F-box domain-containing protein n=1 Tax=Solanum commersonii TaxID=4109 RepID=A0A9J6AA06_SOLCO|nr:hypothetical protein H5410_006679 [Solanum commersonii]